MLRSGRSLSAILAACVLLLPHCSRKDTSFRHDGHVTIVKGACGRCHGEDPANPRPATTADCASCHRQASDPAKAGNYALGGGRRWLPPASYSAARVLFSHRDHSGGGVGCGACHGDGPAPRYPSMGECVACHEGSGVPATCGTCHAEPPAAPPPGVSSPR